MLCFRICQQHMIKWRSDRFLLLSSAVAIEIMEKHYSFSSMEMFTHGSM